MQIKEAELRKNTAQGAIAATMKPPVVGPTTRPMLLARALRVRASDSSDLGTDPLVVGQALRQREEENKGISVAELWRFENPDTFTIDTSRTRQITSADTTPKTVQ